MKLINYLTCIAIVSIVLISGCNKDNKQKEQSTISVLGTGTVLVQPDMVELSITLTNVSQTTRLAQEEVSRMARQVLAILKDAGIEDKNISTASLSFRTEYVFRNGVRVLLGQRAEQRLTFSIEDIDSDSERVSRIIDQFIGINGIELTRLNFGLKNNTEYFIQSRELAFQKAVEKADQYSELSNLKKIKVLSISEEGIPQILPSNTRITNMAFAESQRMDDSSTVLPSGELEITTRILVVFLLE
ncbi:MAG: SIMPL domain-containing protein [Treponema sp.]|nr:SIMPL domain-containing protein [Treponema sp.]